MYDADGFERALELLASPGFPSELLIEPDDVPLGGLIDAIHGLEAGDLAGKVMIVPGGLAMTTEPNVATRSPRFNHVAMSVPSDLLDDDGTRADLCRFYGDVFGFQELPTMTEDRRRLVFGCYTIEQFVFLIADDTPMTCPRLDHYGFSVASEAELDEMLERAEEVPS